MHVTFPPPEEPAPPPDPEEVKPTKAILRDEHNLSKFTDDEVIRYNLGCVLIDPENKVVVATDSRTLVQVPLEECEGKEKVLVSGESLRQIFGIRKKLKHPINDEVEIAAKENTVSVSFVARHGQRVEVSDGKQDGKFPNYQELLPAKDEKFAAEVLLSAKRLRAIAEHALGANGDEDVGLLLRVRKDHEAPVVFQESQSRAVYVLMPMARPDK